MRPGPLCNRVMATLVPAGRAADDVALVAIRPYAEDRSRPAQAGLNVLRDDRRVAVRPALLLLAGQSPLVGGRLARRWPYRPRCAARLRTRGCR